MTSKLMFGVVIGVMAGCAEDVDLGGEEGDIGSHPVVESLGAPAEVCDEGEEPEDLATQLARARAATEKYQDPEVAIADGFIPAEVCVAHPQLGVMGFHFVNPARLADPVILEEPEALMYVKENGAFRLVGIEYLQVILENGMPYMGCGVEDNSCPPMDPGPTPSLFTGVMFDGPMAGHEPGMPWHFDQHVWLFAENPAGTFAQFNPALTCEDGCIEP